MQEISVLTVDVGWKEQTMSRLIDVDALKEDLLINHNTDLMSQSLVLGSGFDVGVDYVMLFIEDAPSIDLVRCGECKYWHNNNPLPTEEDEICPLSTDADDFCSYGVRREDE